MIDPKDDREKRRNLFTGRAMYRKSIHYEERYIACYRELIKKFGDRLQEYDRMALEGTPGLLTTLTRPELNGPYPNVFMPEEQAYFDRALKMAKNPKDRLCVFGVAGFPQFTSPSFAAQAGYQIQALVEKEMEVQKLHKIPRTEVSLCPWELYNHFTPINDEIFRMVEKIDDVWYTQFLFRFGFYHPEIWGDAGVYFWGRCYSPEHPEQPVDLCGEHTAETVRFEIVDAPPPSVCPYDQLPPLLQQYDPFVGRYQDVYEYDPQRWRKDLKKMIDKVLEIERKRSEERKRRREEEKRLLAEGKPIPKKLRWYVSESFFQSFPDATFRLRFLSKVTEEKIELLRKIVSDLNQELGEKGIEYLDFENKKNNECLMTLDFGLGDENTVEQLMEAINRSGLDIRSATIE